MTPARSMKRRPRRIWYRPPGPVRGESCTCGTASRQKGHCVRCAGMGLPQNEQRRMSGPAFPGVAIQLPRSLSPRLDSESWNRQAATCRRVKRGFENSVKQLDMGPFRGGFAPALTKRQEGGVQARAWLQLPEGTRDRTTGGADCGEQATNETHGKSKENPLHQQF